MVETAKFQKSREFSPLSRSTSFEEKSLETLPFFPRQESSSRRRPHNATALQTIVFASLPTNLLRAVVWLSIPRTTRAHQRKPNELRQRQKPARLDKRNMEVTLGIASTVALVPYALLCGMHAVKYLADPWFTDKVLECGRSTWNPRLFRYELQHLAVPLLGGVSATTVLLLGASLLGSGCVGALALPWTENLPHFAFASLVLLCMSFFYFVTVLPYLVYTAQLELLSQPCWMLCLGGLPTAYKVFIEWHDSSLHHDVFWKSSLYLIVTLLLLAEAAIISCMATHADKAVAAVERFFLIKNHFLENGMRWEPNARHPVGYSETRLLLSV